MKVKLIIISIILLLVMVFASGCIPIMEKLGLVSPTNEEQLTPEKGGPPDGLVKVLIGFKEKPGPPEQAIVKGVGGKIKYTYNIIPAIAASVPEVAIEALKKNPNITNVELDSKVYALDTELDNSWGVDRIDAEVVHTAEDGNQGAGVKVAIIDTGIDKDHEDLNFVGGKSFVDYTNDFNDDNGHGTHVAGIVAALDNNVGVVGVAPEAELYVLKALDETGSGYVSDIISAIQWASDPDGDGSANDRLDIINMSFGANVSNIFLRWACNLAYRDGLLLVAAAGNEYGGSVGYPAAYSRVIAVSATDYDRVNNEDILADFSSTGSEVELAAPGVDIYSTLPTYKCTLSSEYGYTYGVLSGTSMACPHVVGTAALVWAENLSLSNKDVRSQLQGTAEDIHLADTEQGYGLVDAENAVLGTTNGDNLNNQQATGNISGTVTDESTGDFIEEALVIANGLDILTDDNGNYAFDNLSAGDYIVTASKTGYATQSKTAVVSGNQTTEIDFVLKPESIPNNTMYIQSINMSLKTAGPNVNANAKVTIMNNSNLPVESATVYGTWSGATNDTDSGVTGSDGQVIFKSDRLKNPKSGTTFTFTVNDVTKDGWTYNSSANIETSDSISVK